MGSVVCPSILLHQETHFCRSDCWTMRTKPARLPVNSIPPPTSVATHYGSSFATGIHTRPAAASAWRPLRVVPNVNWAPTTATARRLWHYTVSRPLGYAVD